MLLRATRFGDLRRRILSWCRRTRISASSAARGRNSPIKAHQINLQRSLIDRTINQFASASQLFWVCGRNSGSGSSASFHAVDVTDERKGDAVFEAIARAEGGIDYMIYCAGIFRPRGLLQMSADDFAHTVSINLGGAFLCCRAALPSMRAQSFGRIVLISSMLARVGAANGRRLLGFERRYPRSRPQSRARSCG